MNYWGGKQIILVFGSNYTEGMWGDVGRLSNLVTIYNISNTSEIVVAAEEKICSDSKWDLIFGANCCMFRKGIIQFNS